MPCAQALMVQAERMRGYLSRSFILYRALHAGGRSLPGYSNTCFRPRAASPPISAIVSALRVVTASRGFANREWLSFKCACLFLWAISILSFLAQCRSGGKRQHMEQRCTVDSNDILVWPDDLWWFREVLCQAFLRSDSYRTILCSSGEWLRFISARQPPVPPPK